MVICIWTSWRHDVLIYVYWCVESFGVLICFLIPLADFILVESSSKISGFWIINGRVCGSKTSLLIFVDWGYKKSVGKKLYWRPAIDEFGHKKYSKESKKVRENDGNLKDMGIKNCNIYRAQIFSEKQLCWPFEPKFNMKPLV